MASQKKLNDYEGFVEKFKPRRTTDDCYTPPVVYDAVLDWAMNAFPDWRGRPVVRPFYPGGDYERYDYPPGCVVIDNPPFSIYSSICRTLSARGIPFLLFAPALTATVKDCDLTYIVTAVDVVYENGALVHTSFVTNHPSAYRFVSAPELREAIHDAQKTEKAQKKAKASPKKIKFHPNVTSVARLNIFPAHGIALRIRKGDCIPIPRRLLSGNVFGQAYLLSDKARRQAEEARRQAEEARRQAEEARRQAEEARRQDLFLTAEGEALLCELNRITSYGTRIKNEGMKE